MPVIDLTHTIWEGMPVYPGTESPRLSEGSSYERDGFRETLLCLYSHTGTHMDAPNHLFAERQTLDRVSVESFVGSAIVIDCTEKQAGELITMENLLPLWEKVEQAEFLLFYTGWARFWGSDSYFGDYPVLDGSVIDYIIRSGKKGVGLDVIGLDPIAQADLPRHKQLLSQSNTLIIENLTNLDQLGDELVTLVALPLKFRQSDGAPTRVIACVNA